MKITKYKFLSLVLIISFFLIQLIVASNINTVQAQTTLWDSQNGMGAGSRISRAFGADATNPIEIVWLLIRIFLGFLGVIFMVLLLLAGYKYMTARGEEEKAREALTSIRHSVVGLLIVLSSYAISYFVVYWVWRSSTGYQY